MSHNSNRSKSLQELDGADWGNPETAETPMIGRVLALRRKPLETLTNAELRLAVGQRVSPPILLELAVEKIRANLLIECDFYPGDLLAALARLKDSDWGSRHDLSSEVASLFKTAMELSSEEADAFRDAIAFTSKHL